jgi:hypothetical protein
VADRRLPSTIAWTVCGVEESSALESPGDLWLAERFRLLAIPGAGDRLPALKKQQRMMNN